MIRPLTLAATETTLLLREPPVLVFAFLFPPLTMLVLGGVFGAAPAVAFGGVAPTHHYVTAYLVVTLAVLGFTALPVAIATYEETGVMRRFAAAGVTPGLVVLAQAGVMVLLAGVGGALVLAVGALAYGLPGPADPAGVAAGLAATAALVLVIGAILGLLAGTARGAQGLGLTMFFPMYLLGGGGPPPGAMTDVMRDVSDRLPLSAAMAAVQKPWLDVGASGGDLLAAVAWTVAGTVVLALLFFRRAA